MPESYGPAEFGEILNSPEQPLIVGGQAVNVWAEYWYGITSKSNMPRSLLDV